jgi:hypothetical protein
MIWKNGGENNRHQLTVNQISQTGIIKKTGNKKDD